MLCPLAQNQCIEYKFVSLSYIVLTSHNHPTYITLSVFNLLTALTLYLLLLLVGGCPPTSTSKNNWSLGPTVFRGKFCQIPRRRLPNSADHRGKFLEFRGSPQPPMSIAWTTAEIWPFFDFGGRPSSWVFKILKFWPTGQLSKANTRLHAKFRVSRSNVCGDMAYFWFFKMAAVRHLGFVLCVFGRPTKSICWSLSLCKIWLESVQ